MKLWFGLVAVERSNDGVAVKNNNFYCGLFPSRAEALDTWTRWAVDGFSESEGWRVESRVAYEVPANLIAEAAKTQ